MLTVQFFGLPGSGKTFLLNRIVKDTAKNTIRFITRQESSLEALRERDDGPLTGLAKKFPAALWHRVIHEDYCLQEMLNFASKNPILYRFMLDVIIRAKVSAELTRSILGAFSRTSVEHELLNSKVNKNCRFLFLADEWFYHRLYTLFSHCNQYPSAEQIEEYLNFAPSSDGTVFIATPPEICLARMNERGDIPDYLKKRSVDEIEAILGKYYKLLELIYEKLLDQQKSVTKYSGNSNQICRVIEYCNGVLSNSE